MEELAPILNQGPTNFNKLGSHLEILGTRRVKWHDMHKKISWTIRITGIVHPLIQGYYVKALLLWKYHQSPLSEDTVYIKIKFVEQQMKHNAMFVLYVGRCLSYCTLFKLNWYLRYVTFCWTLMLTMVIVFKF